MAKQRITQEADTMMEHYEYNQRIGAKQRKILQFLYDEQQRNPIALTSREKILYHLYGTYCPSQSEKSSYSRAIGGLVSKHNSLSDFYPFLVHEGYEMEYLITISDKEADDYFSSHLITKHYRISPHGIERLEALPKSRSKPLNVPPKSRPGARTNE